MTSKLLYRDSEVLYFMQQFASQCLRGVKCALNTVATVRTISVVRHCHFLLAVGKARSSGTYDLGNATFRTSVNCILFNSIETTNKMQPCNRMYYSTVR